MTGSILLLGGSGFVGQNLARHLLMDGYAITVIDQDVGSIRRNSDLAEATCHQFPMGDVAQILTVIEAQNVDCVINLASSLLPSSNFSMFIEDMEHVVLPSFALLTELAARQIRYVFFSSGGTVYGHGGPGLIAESATCEPINFYGQSKKTMEEFIAFVGRNCGLDYLIIRPSNPYGRYQNPLRKQGFIAVALHQIMHDMPVEIWGDGSVVRDYIQVDDLTHAMSMLLRSDASNQIFNVASGCGYALSEVLAILSEVTGRSVNACYRPGRKVDVQSIVLDVAKLQRYVPYAPLGLKAGVEKYYAHLRGRDAE
jgi:UDP-glucose 4-epimerase